MTIKKFILLIFVGVPGLFHAQEMNECVNTILNLESEVYSKKYSNDDKATYFKYHVKSEDWERQITESNVKVYRDLQNIHFFSDQANIYGDGSEMYLVLKQQKIVVANTQPEGRGNSGYGDDFIELRNKFLKKCDIIKCDFNDSTKTIKTLILEVNEDWEDLVSIRKLTYQYNEKQKKVISTKVEYNEDYKIKSTKITYLDYKPSVSYQFGIARKKVLNRQNLLLERFKGYEFIDERK